MTGRAAVIGLGGLGAPAAALLAASGVEALTLIDPDEVAPSNLPRQPLYGTADIGRKKVEAAASQLSARAPNLATRAVDTRLNAANAEKLLADAQVVLDGTDNLATKVLLNELALSLGIPLVHAGVLGLDGQLTSILPGKSACLRCLFLELPEEADLPTCQQAGILGPVVGAIGLASAREALYLLRGKIPPLANRFAILDGRTLRWRALERQIHPDCPACSHLAV